MTRRSLVPADLYRFLLPSDPVLAADGRVFYVLAAADEPADESRTSIWVASVDGSSPPRAFTSGIRDRMPRPSPDGATLAFIGDRGAGKRVYAMATDGGEARALTPAYDTIAGLAWSHDGTRLAFVATTALDAPTAVIALDERTGARHIRALPFKSDDDGLLDGRRRHLHTVPASGGEPLRVTHGDFDVNSPAWSPDGREIAFTAKRNRPETWFCDDLFVVASEGGAPRKLTASLGPALVPAWSHDGTHIAYFGHEHGDDLGGLENLELLVIPRAGGAARSLSFAYDRPVSNFILSDTRAGGTPAPAWSANDEEVYAPVTSEGACGIVAFARDGTRSRSVVGGERDVFAMCVGAGDAIAFGVSSPAIPAEIAYVDARGVERTLTACNPWLAECVVRVPRRVRPTAADGTVLDLWLLDSDESARGPWVLQVHGGPHASYGWSFMFEFQTIAAQGIGVAYGNPRGGQGYGAAYASAIVGDWGGIDAADVLCLADAAVAHASIDESRFALAGGSYGGFMTTWLLGHTKRFAAGISMRAVNDFVSEVGATDVGWFLERELAAPWTDGGRRLFDASPMRSAHEIDVPLLVEHSERDYRCAIDQGEQLFTLLRRLGHENVEFVRFAGDGHGLSRTGKPRNRLLRLRAILHWLIRHLRPAGIEPVGDYAGALFAPVSPADDLQLPVP
jgi:dipeptidyl aminopeptidase/acylaminoacyl peptidase